MNCQCRSLDDLEQSLLHALAANILPVRDLRSADLVDLIKADDPSFCGRDVVVRGCEQALDADFGVFAYVACLGEGRAVGHAEGHGEDAGEGFGHESFADAGGAEEEDVCFVEGWRGGVLEGGRAD